MSYLNTECPVCSSEDAYHDGCEYVCPNCDHKWGRIDFEEGFEDIDDDE